MCVWWLGFENSFVMLGLENNLCDILIMLEVEKLDFVIIDLI